MATRSNLSQARADVSPARSNLSQARTSSTFNRSLLDASFGGVATVPILHFDPKRGVNYDGSNAVTDWLDLVGRYRANQGVTSKKPTFLVNGFGTDIPALSLASASSQVMLFTTGAVLIGTKNFTISVVVKLASLSGVQHIFNFGDAAIGPGFSFNFGGTGKREVFSKGVGSAEFGTATTDAEIWTMTVNNSSVIATYVNGTLVANSSPGMAFNQCIQGGTIGARTSSQFLNGLLGHVLAWNTPLSGSDITLHVNALKAIYGIA